MPADLALMLLPVMATLLREGLWITGLLILINGVDELAIDVALPFAWAKQRLSGLPDPPHDPGRFAILVPAWQESDVIGPMLRSLLSTLDHPDYRVHVGVYPNDPVTAEEVLKIEDPRIVLVTTAQPGPTTKADCLNHLWRSVLESEAGQGQVKAIILHDAEDVLHPGELRVFDRGLQRHAMVQIPVVPILDAGGSLVGGHYLDEFAITHARDMVVRTAFKAPVPSAGVGTAIRRDAMLALDNGSGTPFDAQSLTEDYEIGYRLHALGYSAAMVRHRAGGQLVAVREYFPDHLEPAVRQKARWLQGIALSGWDRLGWTQSPMAAWMMMRDRKAVPVAVLGIIGYLLLSLFLLGLLLERWLGLPPGIGPVRLDSDRDQGLIFLLGLTGLLLGWRLVVRMACTWRAAGPVEAMLSIPRAPIGNLVNALAALRAFQRYQESLRLGRPLDWDKTQHRFPGTSASAHG